MSRPLDQGPPAPDGEPEPRWFATGNKAVGFIALGNVVTGVIAFGNVARGFIAVGNVAVGVVAVGNVAVGIVAGVGANLGVGLLGYAATLALPCWRGASLVMGDLPAAIGLVAVAVWAVTALLTRGARPAARAVEVEIAPDVREVDYRRAPERPPPRRPPPWSSAAHIHWYLRRAFMVAAAVGIAVTAARML